MTELLFADIPLPPSIIGGGGAESNYKWLAAVLGGSAGPAKDLLSSFWLVHIEAQNPSFRLPKTGIAT
jgi:hypothetical protein